MHLLTAGQLNTYDVLVSDEVVFIRAALDEFLAHAGATSSITATDQAPAEPATPAVEAQATPATGRHAAPDARGTTAQADDAAPALEKDPADEGGGARRDRACGVGQDYHPSQ